VTSKLLVGLSALGIIVVLAIITFAYAIKPPSMGGGDVTTLLRIWPFAILVAFALIVGFIGFQIMVAGEEICLDRHPWWGPPESGYNDSCSGHIYERMHPRSP
jgi:hypothetical protein